METEKNVDRMGKERGADSRNRRRNVLLALVVTASVLALPLAYLWGAYSYSNSIPPLPQILKFIEPDIDSGTLISFDRYDRLVAYPGKEQIPCPEQRESTLVLLILGQSNAANVAGQRYVSSYGPKVVNYFAGQCFVASSPLYGTNNLAGESWTLLGNKVIEARLADTVVLIPSAIGRSEVRRWARGDLSKMLDEVLNSVPYEITYVLWHQGEQDFVLDTAPQDYIADFRSVASRFRAPIFVSVATRCGVNVNWRAGNPLAEAQRSLPDGRLILAGVDTDSLMEQPDRYEDCHFSASGQEKFTDAWLQILTEHLNGSTDR